MNKFRCYTTSRGGSEILEWVNSLPPKHLAKVQSVMTLLGERHRLRWCSTPSVTKVSSYDLYEISFSFSFSLGKEYRIVGYFIDGSDIFIMLHCFSKNTARSQNRKAFNLAEQRRKQIMGKEEDFTHEYSFEKDEVFSETIH